MMLVIPGRSAGTEPGIHFYRYSCGAMDSGSDPSGHPGMTGHFAGVLCPPAAFFRDRAAARARSRSIWPRGKVTQISPIHSSLTPAIGLALKLEVDDMR